MATDRIIVHSSIVSNFLQGLKAGLASMSSSSAAPPRVVSVASKNRLKSIVSSALSNGAHVVSVDGTVGEKSEQPFNEGTPTTFIPTILGDVTDDMQIWNDEAFGPVVAYCVVESEDEAIKIANNTGYGLSAAVFTQDLRKGLAIAKRLESG